MFKTRPAKHWLLKPETRLRAGLESREKEIGSQCEHLLGGAKEGGMYRWVQEEGEGVCDGTITGTQKSSLKINTGEAKA